MLDINYDLAYPFRSNKVYYLSPLMSGPCLTYQVHHPRYILIYSDHELDYIDPAHEQTWLQCKYLYNKMISIQYVVRTIICFVNMLMTCHNLQLIK